MRWEITATMEIRTIIGVSMVGGGGGGGRKGSERCVGGGEGEKKTVNAEECV